jgi:gas vesicle protein
VSCAFHRFFSRARWEWTLAGGERPTTSGDWRASQNRRGELMKILDYDKVGIDGLVGLFLGLGFGVGIGMLFAPKSGGDTRGALKGKADESARYLKKQATDLREAAGQVISDLYETGQNTINRQTAVLNDAIDAGKEAYREKIESAQALA